MAEIKRITLHPLFDDGSVDTNVNLYPKTLLDGIVDRNGNEVEVATQEDIPTKLSELDNDSGFVTQEYVDSSKSSATNLENGSGTNSLQQKTINTEEPNIASGHESIAFNHKTQAIQKGCAAFGGGTIAGNRYIEDAESTYGFAFAIGEMSKALGRGSFSSGNSTEALNQYSATFGLGTKSSRDCELVAGTYNDITAVDMDKALFVVGNGTSTSSRHNALVVYKNGIAELDNQGKTANSIVIYATIPDLRKGTGARSVIQIHGAQANVASGQSAIALGMGCQATATRSVAIGEGLIGNVSNTTYVGKYNDSSIKNTLFVVGNGSNNSSRSNAFVVYKDGHAEINVVGSSNKSIVNKEYVDTNVVHKGSLGSPSNETIYGTKTFAPLEEYVDFSHTIINEKQIALNCSIEQNFLPPKSFALTNGVFVNRASLESHMLLGVYDEYYDSQGSVNYLYAHGFSYDGITKIYNDNEYLLTIPDKSGTIATTDDCGTKLYKHTIFITDDYANEINLYIINTKSIPYTYSTFNFNAGDLQDKCLKAYMDNPGYGVVYDVSGYYAEGFDISYLVGNQEESIHIDALSTPSEQFSDVCAPYSAY